MTWTNHDLSARNGRYQALLEALQQDHSLEILRKTMARVSIPMLQAHIYREDMRSLQLQLNYVDRAQSREVLDRLVELQASGMAEVLSAEQAEVYLWAFYEPRIATLESLQELAHHTLGRAVQGVDTELAADINERHMGDPLDVEGSMARAGKIMADFGMDINAIPRPLMDSEGDPSELEVTHALEILREALNDPARAASARERMLAQLLSQEQQEQLGTVGTIPS